MSAANDPYEGHFDAVPTMSVSERGCFGQFLILNRLVSLNALQINVKLFEYVDITICLEKKLLQTSFCYLINADVM